MDSICLNWIKREKMIELYDRELRLIKDASGIEGAFKDDYGYDLFEQNTTDCYEEGSALIKTEDGKYYEVNVFVTMVGSWQDVGGRLYTIDTIDRVTYKEIEYDKLVINFNNKLKYKINFLNKEITELNNKIIKD